MYQREVYNLLQWHDVLILYQVLTFQKKKKYRHDYTSKPLLEPYRLTGSG